MPTHTRTLLTVTVLLMTACTTHDTLRTPQAVISLPGGKDGLDLDDMVYSAALQRVIVPAGRTGDVDLIDPATHKVTVIPGAADGADVTSASYGLGFVFAGDRTGRRLLVIDGKSKAVRERVRLAAQPDYVRYVPSRDEVWVTEPKAQRIEVFHVRTDAVPLLVKTADLTVAGGPESLAVDGQQGVAYTNLWSGTTVAIDLVAQRIVGRWTNTCRGSRGLALAPAAGVLFVGCKEGKVVSLDTAHGGQVIASAPAGSGVDIIAYDADTHRLFVPGARSETLTIFNVAPSGQLQATAAYRTAARAHCVVSDDSGTAYVCDPRRGRLLVITDNGR